MDKASDFESGDCRFESCQGRFGFISASYILIGKFKSFIVIFLARVGGRGALITNKFGKISFGQLNFGRISFDQLFF